MGAMLRGGPWFLKSALRYRSLAAGKQFPLHWRNTKPMVLDRADKAGEGYGHYFHQDLWAARKVYAAQPRTHLDIGSRIDGFVAHLLVFMGVDVVDIRPLEAPVTGLHFVQADATNLDAWADGSVESLSSLHAIEHFGLGRYGDAIDPDACFRAMHSLQRVLAREGMLYFSVPVGRERVEFNSQRIFSPHTVIEAFRDLELTSLAGVDDKGCFLANAQPADLAACRNACGLFEFRKP
jgi:hypothetical protein